MPIQQGVGIGPDEELAAREQRADVERRRFASVLREMDDAELWDVRGECVEELGRAIGRSVIDRDDLEVRIVDGSKGGAGFFNLRLLVVAGDENGNRRIAVECGGASGGGSWRPRSQW